MSATSERSAYITRSLEEARYGNPRIASLFMSIGQWLQLAEDAGVRGEYDAMVVYLKQAEWCEREVAIVTFDLDRA